MSFTKIFIHLFFPHESNNQRAKIIHPTSFWLIAVFVVFSQILITGATKIFPSVLGCASNISPEEVIRLTNEQRLINGLDVLKESSVLSSAAQAKGADMLNKGYWAHFAPDGTSPWSFFINFGYRYTFAGENLARDFCSASDAVRAWMNSPSHKENILSPNYKEIGIGVVQGNLSGSETTIIVQFFGSRLNSESASIPVAKAQVLPSPSSTPTPSPLPVAFVQFKETPTPTNLPTPVFVGSSTGVSISPFITTKDISLGITGTLLAVLSIDLIIVRRKRIIRIGGRTLAHIAFLGMILAVVLILKAGRII